jgi:hypothetical protein
VGVIPAWLKATVSGTNDVVLSYDETLKSEGKASLKVDYTLSAAGTAGVGPVLSHKTTVGQLANFNSISVDVLNPDEREKSIELLLKAADGKIYKAAFVGYEGSSAQETAVSIGKTSSFKTLAFDIKTLKDNTGAAVANAAGILANIASLQFTIADNAAGTIYIDNVLFGLSTEELSLPVNANTVGESKVDVRVVNNILSVKTDINNPIRKIELIDIQGRTVNSTDNINSAEYSFKLSSASKILIARIQSEKSVSVKKLIVD